MRVLDRALDVGEDLVAIVINTVTDHAWRALKTDRLEVSQESMDGARPRSCRAAHHISFAKDIRPFSAREWLSRLIHRHVSSSDKLRQPECRTPKKRRRSGGIRGRGDPRT
jgi:hypothetical protein